MDVLSDVSAARYILQVGTAFDNRVCLLSQHARAKLLPVKWSWFALWSKVEGVSLPLMNGLCFEVMALRL